MELDHIVAINKGGSWWEESNLQILCRDPCHFLKTGAENRLNSVEKDAWAAIVATEIVKV